MTVDGFQGSLGHHEAVGFLQNRRHSNNVWLGTNGFLPNVERSVRLGNEGGIRLKRTRHGWRRRVTEVEIDDEKRAFLLRQKTLSASSHVRFSHKEPTLVGDKKGEGFENDRWEKETAVLIG
jgi:hypothetical protein